MTSETGAAYGQPLTPRESQVCEYLCLGWTNKEIAQALRLSSRTVEDHRAHVYLKKGVRNSVELVRQVYRIMEFGPSAKPTHEIVEPAQ